MSSEIASRNVFRFVYGERFWDQIYSTHCYKVEWAFSLFLKLCFIQLFAKYTLVLANIKWMFLADRLIFYCIVWRSYKLCSLRSPRRWRRAPLYWSLTRYSKKRFFKKIAAVNTQFKTVFILKNKSKSRKLFFKKIFFRNFVKFSRIKKNFLVHLSVKKKLFLIKMISTSTSPFPLTRVQTANQLFANFSHYFQKKIPLIVFFKNLKKRWFAERLFSLFLAVNCQNILFSFGLKKNLFKTFCILNDLSLIWQFKARQFLLNSNNTSKYNPSKFYFILFYQRAGLKVSKAKQVFFVWRNWLLFMYYSWLTKDWNAIIGYCRWFFEVWQRKKQGVFLFFLRRIFGHALLPQFMSFDQQLSLPWIFITFSGRVSGKHKATYASVRPFINYRQPMQKLNKNLSHYYTQFITKYGVYGVHWWILYNEITLNLNSKQIIAKI